MSENLEEFWIFSKEGEAMVNFYKSTNDDKTFNYRKVSFDADKLTEIRNIISSNLHKSSKNNKAIMIENDLLRYGQCLHNDLIIFYKTNPNAKEKRALNICNIISNVLEDSYPSDKLQFWEGDLSFFEKFKSKVNLYFKMSGL